MNPSLEPLLLITRLLEQAGIPYALGGSGLLYSLGLTHSVRDWDVTTEVSLDSILQVLDHLPHHASASGDYPFASSYRLSIQLPQQEIDLIGNFTIQTESGLVHLPVIPTARWEGVWVGSPEVWFVAYHLMGRMQKAELLYEYLLHHGANPDVLAIILAQPLSASVRDLCTKLLDCVSRPQKILTDK